MNPTFWNWMTGLLPIRVERVSEAEMAALRTMRWWGIE